MKLLAALLVSFALVLASACGDDEDSNDEPAATTQTQTEPAPETSEEDDEAVEETVVRWTFEGDCDLMTDRFLEAQLLGLGEGRKERCDLFEKQHQKPQYSEDQMKIEDVRVTGTKASLIVTSDLAPDIRSRYDLVKTGGQWRIDAAELQ